MKKSNAHSFLEAASNAGQPPVLVGLNIDTSRLKKALKTPDDVGAIMRIHQNLDRELRRIVKVMVPKASQGKLRTTNQWIECLGTAGLSEQRIAASRTINHVRNEFAHGDKERFVGADVNRLLAAIRLVLGENYEPTALHDLTTDPYGQWDYQNMDCKGQFCILGYTAVALIASVEYEFEKHSFKPKLPRLIRFDQIQTATKPHNLLVFLNH